MTQKIMFVVLGLLISYLAGADTLKCIQQDGPLICKDKQGKEVSVVDPSRNGSSKLTGEINHLNSDGKLRRWQRFEDGKLAEAKFFHPNGNLQRHEKFKAGKKQGESVEYSEKGKLISKINWVDDKQEGPYTEYLPYEYELKKTGSKKNFQNHGFVTTEVKGGHKNVICYQEGQETVNWSLCDSKYKNQKREALKYFENGSMMSKIDIVNGDKIGQETWYYSNGKVNREGQNRNNQPIGTWIWNSNDGVKTKTVEYKTKTHFTENKYYPSGQLEESTEIKDEKTQSQFKYYMNGKKKSETIYDQPTRASYKYYDDQERVLEEGKLVQPSQSRSYSSWSKRLEKDGLIKTYNYKDGLKSECEMKEGSRSGWCREYDLASSQLKTERLYEKDKMKAEKIYEKGQLQSSKEFFEDGSEKK